MTDKITVSSPSYEAWVQSREQYAIGTNCGWCGRGLPGGAPPLADRIVALEVELAERTRERDEARMHFSMVAMHYPDGDMTISAVRRQAEEWLREHDAAERERREAAEKDAARWLYARRFVAAREVADWPKWASRGHIESFLRGSMNSRVPQRPPSSAPQGARDD